MPRTVTRISLLIFSLAPGLVLAEGKSCPEYSAPLCVAGERLDVEIDANGCNVASCVKAAAMAVDDIYDQSCPAYERVECGKDENPSSATDANGCKVATCEKIPE